MLRAKRDVYFKCKILSYERYRPLANNDKIAGSIHRNNELRSAMMVAAGRRTPHMPYMNDALKIYVKPIALRLQKILIRVL
jgi:hypothetical protein